MLGASLTGGIETVRKSLRDQPPGIEAARASSANSSKRSTACPRNSPSWRYRAEGRETLHPQAAGRGNHGRPWEITGRSGETRQVFIKTDSASMQPVTVMAMEWLKPFI